MHLALFIDKVNKRPSKREVGNTDITLHTTTKIYHVDVSNIGGYHSFRLKFRKTDKRILILYQTETTKQFVKRKNVTPDKNFTNNSYLACSFRV